MQKDYTVTSKYRELISRLNRNSLLSDVVIMILCCIAGVFAKKMINPFANVITDALHVPGGISTSFSLMFLVIASGITTRRCSASLMGVMQAIVAISIGSFGSMGMLMPLAYVVPGIVIDLIMLIPEKGHGLVGTKAFIANILSSVSAAVFADVVVFHLPIKPLFVYILLASLIGAICGFIAGIVIDSYEKRVKGKDKENE